MNEPRAQGRPEWLRKKKSLTPEVLRTRRRIEGLGLRTVCESAQCPNLGECYACGNATFLIMGGRCSRDCRFCAVEGGAPEPLDPAEGQKIASYIASAGIRYAVITSVTRDDLPDGGAGHFGSVVAELKRRLPALRLELLVPDFRGSPEAIRLVAGLPIEVFGHNLETVEGLYARVRPSADYGRSLAVLRLAGASRRPGVLLKTGIMVGLGERPEALARRPVNTAIPSAANCSVSSWATSASSRASRWGAPCTRVTVEPKRAKAWAISQPIGPAPMTARRLGRSVKENTFSFVRNPASANPLIRGCTARAPVAITAFLKRKDLPATSTVSGPVNLAFPRKTSTPRSLKRFAESW